MRISRTKSPITGVYRCYECGYDKGKEYYYDIETTNEELKLRLCWDCFRSFTDLAENVRDENS